MLLLIFPPPLLNFSSSSASLPQASHFYMTLSFQPWPLLSYLAILVLLSQYSTFSLPLSPSPICWSRLVYYFAGYGLFLIPLAALSLISTAKSFPSAIPWSCHVLTFYICELQRWLINLAGLVEDPTQKQNFQRNCIVTSTSKGWEGR